MKPIKMTRTYRLLIRLRPVLRFVKTRILHTDDAPERVQERANAPVEPWCLIPVWR